MKESFLKHVDIDSEKQMIARLMNDRNDSILLVADKLKPEHFGVKSYGIVYAAIIKLLHEGKPVDVIHVKMELPNSFDITELLDLEWVNKRRDNLDRVADYIIDLWKERKCDEIKLKMNDVDNPIEYGITELSKLTEVNSSHKGESVSEILPRALELAEKRQAAYRRNEVMPDVIETGDRDIDESGIFRLQEVTVLAARPGMGKSTMAREWALGMARNGAHVTYYSLEMSKEEITLLFMCSIAEVNSEKMRKGCLSDQEYTRFLSASTILQKLTNLVIDVITSLSSMVLDLRKTRARIGHETKMSVFADYMQQIENEKSNRNREQEIAQISKTLMEISKSLNMCVAEVSQLSRAVETRGGDKRPIMSDTRESGAIEQDANAMVFLYCPYYYGFETDDEGEPTVWFKNGFEYYRKLEIIIAKNRGGRCYTILKKLQLQYGKTKGWNEYIDEGMPADNKIILPSKNVHSDVPF